MKNVCTYLLIKSSVLSVTDHQKPSLDGVTSAAQFKRLNDFFNDSFIKVDNPYAIHNKLKLDGIMKDHTLVDGLYPVDGIEFEVNAPCCKMNPAGCDDCINFNPLAVVSLVEAKEEDLPEELADGSQREMWLDVLMYCDRIGKQRPSEVIKMLEKKYRIERLPNFEDSIPQRSLDEIRKLLNP